MIELECNLVKSALGDGKLVCIPTDTLYALTCDATNDAAIQKIYALKQRDLNKALPIFVKSFDDALHYADFNDNAIKLAKLYWPGALTMILPATKGSNLSNLLHTNNDNIALRIPNSPYLNKILAEIEFPIVATSANLSNRDNNLTIESVRKDFGTAVDIYVEDGKSKISKVASTIIDCTTYIPKIVRHGEITESEIIKACV